MPQPLIQKKLKLNDSIKHLQNLLELTPKDVLFIIGDWNAKAGSQEIPGVTGKFGLGIQNEAGKTLTEFCQEWTLVLANIFFQQHKKQLYTWTSSDGQYRNQIDYILWAKKWKTIYNQQKQNQELTVAHINSVQFSHSVVSDSLRLHGLQHERLPCPSPTPRAYINSIHWVSDAIQPSHPLSAPFPPAFNLSQLQGLFQWVSSSHQVAKGLEFQLQHQSFKVMFRTDL